MKRIVPKQLGGTGGALAVGAFGQAGFTPGERVMLFLEVRPRDGTLYTTALGEGKWRIERGGGQAERVLAQARRGKARGYDVAIEATGVPEVWADAVRVVRPGGVVNLFGGCAPGTTFTLDTTLLHYHELTVKGVYHHRPATARSALELLAANAFGSRELLSADRPLGELEAALRSMMSKEALKVILRPR